MVQVSTPIIQTSTEAVSELLSDRSTGTSMLHGGGRNRDSWCTQQWLTDALGRFNVDPCSNGRSTVNADLSLCLDAGHDGLAGLPGQYLYDDTLFQASQFTRTFINPPYSRGQVIRWIRHWANTDFTFLLRWDPSTAWWRELMSKSRWVWFADQRIQFDPPPGVSGSNNPFPHALYFAHPHGPPHDVRKRLNQLGRFAFVYNRM